MKLSEQIQRKHLKHEGKAFQAYRVFDAPQNAKLLF